MTTTPTVLFREYSRYSGCLIRGKQEFTGVTRQHVSKMTWLASHVETGGIIGTIQSYDGAGMSAGLQHEIAVYPRTLVQGPLFKSLDKLRDELGPDDDNIEALMQAFAEKGWLLDINGILRKSTSGKEVSGIEIRETFTPVNGKVPNSGPEWEEAKRWAILFYNIFNHPNSSNILIKIAMASMSKLDRFEREAYKQVTGLEDPSVWEGPVRPDQDLALCVYQSHAVNAPSIAKNVLLASRPDGTSEWPKRFLKALNDTRYGNWDRRWLKTRTYAIKQWPEFLFEGSTAIMPEDP